MLWRIAMRLWVVLVALMVGARAEAGWRQGHYGSYKGLDVTMSK